MSNIPNNARELRFIVNEGEEIGPGYVWKEGSNIRIFYTRGETYIKRISSYANGIVLSLDDGQELRVNTNEWGSIEQSLEITQSPQC